MLDSDLADEPLCNRPFSCSSLHFYGTDAGIRLFC